MFMSHFTSLKERLGAWGVSLLPRRLNPWATRAQITRSDQSRGNIARAEVINCPGLESPQNDSIYAAGGYSMGSVGNGNAFRELSTQVVSQTTQAVASNAPSTSQTGADKSPLATSTPSSEQGKTKSKRPRRESKEGNACKLCNSYSSCHCNSDSMSDSLYDGSDEGSPRRDTHKRVRRCKSVGRNSRPRRRHYDQDQYSDDVWTGSKRRRTARRDEWEAVKPWNEKRGNPVSRQGDAGHVQRETERAVSAPADPQEGGHYIQFDVAGRSRLKKLDDNNYPTGTASRSVDRTERMDRGRYDYDDGDTSRRVQHSDRFDQGRYDTQDPYATSRRETNPTTSRDATFRDGYSHDTSGVQRDEHRSAYLKQLLARIKIFDGTLETFPEWLGYIKLLADFYGNRLLKVVDATRLQVTPLLTSAIDELEPRDTEHFFVLLTRKFSNAPTGYAAAAKLDHIRQHGLSLTAHNAHFLEQLVQIGEGVNCRSYTIINTYIKSLQDASLQRRLNMRAIRESAGRGEPTLRDMMNYAEESRLYSLTNSHMAGDMESVNAYEGEQLRVSAVTTHSSNHKRAPILPKEGVMYCSRHMSVDHWTNRCKVNNSDCVFCKGSNHTRVTDCPRMICFQCKEQGHTQWVCPDGPKPKWQPRTSGQGNNSYYNNNNNGYSSTNSTPIPAVESLVDAAVARHLAQANVARLLPAQHNLTTPAPLMNDQQS